MAPVLTFTAEEIWQVLTKNPEDSVMLATWHALPEQAQESVLVTRWQQIREVRAEVSKVLEELRVAGKIGSSLQAEVEIRASGAKHDLLASLGNDLRLVLICSKANAGQGRRCRRRGRRRHAQPACQVPALLALARGRRRECRASRIVRALRCQPARRRRAAFPCLGFASWLGLSGLVIVLDQLTKLWVVSALKLGQSIELTSFFNLVFVYNPGAAFSFLSDAGWLAALVLRRAGDRRVGVADFADSPACGRAPAAAGGGADPRRRAGQRHRPHPLRRGGGFLDVHAAGWHWPAFNVADSAISRGRGAAGLAAAVPRHEGKK
jgi:hypothetical protein